MDGTAAPAGPLAPEPPERRSFWLWVMCLTGLDLFSSLGFQPSIAFDAAGVLAPLATVLLAAALVFGALPVYCFVAKHSPHGQGSVAMLEKLVPGWTGKALVLVLLGFAATDFVLTKTLCAADAAEHLLANPAVAGPLGLRPPADAEDAVAEAAHVTKVRWRLGLTFVLLVLLGALFLRGFSDVVGLAVLIVGAYLALTAIVVGLGLWYLVQHPELASKWWVLVKSREANWYIQGSTPLSGTGSLAVAAACVWLFPKLALGLSGFETGVAVMPLIKAGPDDRPDDLAGRVRNTRKLLATAAIVMALFLLASALVVASLIPPRDLSTIDGRKMPAVSRALAYLAHGESPEPISPLFGQAFGTAYDLATIVILWFAGASAMAGLLNLVPQYLPRYGMAPNWARATRPLVLLFTGISLLVTWVFNADVEAQGGACATGVLVLITSAGLAAAIGRYQEQTGPWWRRLPWGYVLVTVLFVYTTVVNVLERPDGVKIAAIFIGAIIVSSLLSRMVRARELRFAGFEYADDESRFLWASIEEMELPILVPHRPGKRSLTAKEAIIRREHRLPPEQYVLFIEVELKDASEFYQRPCLQVIEEEGRFVLRITRAASIAHTLAAVALELSKTSEKPPEVHFGWTGEGPVAGTIGFLVFGEGNVPWMVHELIRRAEPNPPRRPAVVVGGV